MPFYFDFGQAHQDHANELTAIAERETDLTKRYAALSTAYYHARIAHHWRIVPDLQSACVKAQADWEQRYNSKPKESKA